MKRTSIILFFLLLVPLVFAAPTSVVPTTLDFDQILVNSQNWEDVYYGLLFAKLTGTEGTFIVDADSALPLVSTLPQAKEDVLLLQPSRNQQYKGVERALKDEGFNIVELDGIETTAYQLLDASSPSAIILTSTQRPQDSVLLAPFAIQRNAFVLFVDSLNIEDYSLLLEEKNVPLYIYGTLDEGIEEQLSTLNPTIIQEGGKYENNLYLLDRFFEEDDGKQIIIATGNALEEGLIDDFNPVLYIGSNTFPDLIVDYLGTHDITHGVVIGDELVSVVSKLKQQVLLKYNKEMFFVAKVGKTPRTSSSMFSTPDSLDYFPLPTLRPSLTLISVTYNQLTKQLEVTYENPSLIDLYFTGSFALALDDETITLGDDVVQPLRFSQQTTLLYDIDLEGRTIQNITASILFGDDPKALDYLLEEERTVSTVSIDDRSALSLEKIVYDKANKAFYITLKNPSEADVYSRLALIDVVVDGETITLDYPDLIFIPTGEEKEVYIRAKLTDLDILENEEVLVSATYGQREKVLFKKLETTLLLKTRFLSQQQVLFAGIGIVIILIILFLLFGRKKGRNFTCDRCGETVYAKSNPGRHVCGGRFR